MALEPEIVEVTPPQGYQPIAVDDMTVESNTLTAEELKAETEAEKPVKEEKPVEAPKVAKPRNDPQARIDQAVAKQREAERRAEAAERRALELQAPKSKEPEKAKEAPAAAWKRFAAMPDAPKLDQFETIEEFNFAVGDFIAEKREQERAAQTRQSQALSAQEQAYFKTAEAFIPRWEAAKADDPDFIERVNPRLLSEKAFSAMNAEERQNATIYNFLVDQVMKSEHPKDVLLHLSDPKTAQRLAALQPDDIIRELARFEAGLSAAHTVPAPKVEKPKSQATPPIQTVKGSSHVAADDEPSDEDDVDTFIRKGNAQERRLRAAHR